MPVFPFTSVGLLPPMGDPQHACSQDEPTPDDDGKTLIDRAVACDDALSELFAKVHDDLEAVARRARMGWSPPPSLLTLDLVSEAYLRLTGNARPRIRSHDHFLAIAARTMRWILLNRHRRRRAEALSDTLDIPDAPMSQDEQDLLALDAALKRLEAFDPSRHKLVEAKFFLGLEMSDVATCLGISERTAHRRWREAKHWLFRELSGSTEHGTREDRAR